jgi:hypothetical protein
MKEWFWTGLVIVGSAVAFPYATQSLGAEQHRAVSASSRNADAVFDHLLPVVYLSDKPIRLYYRGECPSTARDPVPFPLVKVQPAAKGKTGLAAVRDVFKHDRNVTVTEDSTGIIRIWVGRVPAAILKTKIPRLSLNRDPADQYNPSGVLQALMGTKEMDAAGDALGFLRPTTLGYSGVVPDKRLRHLPGTLRNMSADQVLDEVAKTWVRRIVVIYGACSEPQKPDRRRPYVLTWDGQATWPGDLGPNG